LQVRRAYPPSMFRRFHAPFAPSPHAAAATARRSIDVENDQELSIEPVHAGRYAGELAIEVDGNRLALRVRQLEHFANGVDQEPEGLPLASMPIAIGVRSFSSCSSSRRRRRSIIVTMRPRRLS